jgi:hypothetical protein
MKRAIWILATWLCLAAVAHGTPPAEPIAGRYLSENEDTKIRSRRVAGIEHIRGFTKPRDGSWTGATRSKPEDGGMCEAKLWYSREVKP